MLAAFSGTDSLKRCVEHIRRRAFALLDGRLRAVRKRSYTGIVSRCAPIGVRTGNGARAYSRTSLSLVSAFVASTAGAQSELAGTVFATGASRQPVTSAVVEIPRLGIQALSDTAGRFRLSGVPDGTHAIVVRAIGFEPDTSSLTFRGNESIFRDFVIERSITTLSEVKVEGTGEAPIPAKLAGFMERRRLGIGRHLDRDAITRFENRRTADIFSTIPGVTVRRGRSSKAWVTSGRGLGTGQGAMKRAPARELLDRSDIEDGAPVACYMDVYLDGVLIYNSSATLVPLFNINSIVAADIEAIEVYSGAAQVPAQYNRTSGGCGVVLIWTRVS